VSTVNKILHRKKGSSFKKETVKAVYLAARELRYDVGGLKREHRRVHERQASAMAVLFRLYLENGKHFDSGTAVLRNVSLSGALLGAIVLPRKAIPVHPFLLGFHAPQGPLNDVEIVGRPVRLVHTSEGIEIAMEFQGIRELELRRLRKIVSTGGRRSAT